MHSEVRLKISGMDCASCVMHIENGVKKLKGVHDVSVNFAIEVAKVGFDSDQVTVEQIVGAVKKAGYSAEVEGFGERASHAGMSQPGMEHEGASHHDHAAMESEREIRSKLYRVVFGSVASLIVVALAFWVDVPFEHMIMLLLTLFILLYTGSEFYKRGIPALFLRLRPNMDTLVALGVSAAFLYSTYNVLFTTVSEEYFMDAAIISTFIMLGRYLEARAKGNASAAIKKLLSLGAKMAHKIVGGKKTEDIGIDQVQKGDLLLVRPGEKVPVDGVITEGSPTIDESMVTGESVPVDKEAFADVIGATINSNMTFTMRAEKIGKETVLAQMVALVEEAQMNKPPIQKLVDTVSNYFVWVVMAAALVTFFVWNGLTGSAAVALIPTVAVLIIACPCALGLATPISIVVGSGRGAEMGILLKRAESLEKMNKVTVFCFDKTGTITDGKMKVSEMIPYDVPAEVDADFALDGVSFRDGEKYLDQLMGLIAAVEHQSEHPIARAVVHFAEGRGAEIGDAVDVKAVPGKGVEGMVGKFLVRVGNRKFLADSGVMRCAELDEKADELERQGKTVLFFAVDLKQRGIIVLRDQPKESSKLAIELLHKRGIKTIMMTGDNKHVAQSIAAEVGIDEVMSEVSPREKTEKIRELQDRGEFVAMVGDGINDAPALATAHTGIAMGTGTDVAIESGDIVLVKGDLMKAVEAMELSRATLRNIKQNLFWAFIYNSVGIPIAALGLLSPIFSAGAMAFSSISVVLNALRLKRFRVR